MWLVSPGRRTCRIVIQLLAVRNSPEVDYTIVNHMDLGEVDGDNLSDARTSLVPDTLGRLRLRAVCVGETEHAYYTGFPPHVLLVCLEQSLNRAGLVKMSGEEMRPRCLHAVFGGSCLPVWGAPVAGLRHGQGAVVGGCSGRGHSRHIFAEQARTGRSCALQGRASTGGRKCSHLQHKAMAAYGKRAG